MELNNKSLAHIRGFNYQPSFAGHGIPRWIDRYNAATIEAELRRGRELFPWTNTVRIWLSLDAWWDDPKRFLANLDKEVEIHRKLGLKMMPVLFNGITNIPDFGSLTPTDADRFMKPDGGHNLRVLYLDYVKAIAERYAGDDIVVAWDLCNEPGLHYKSADDPIRKAFFYLLEKSAGELRDAGVTAPIGVGNYGPLNDDEDVVGFVDCLLTHRYHVPHCMAYEQYVANVAETAEFANKHNLPWCVSECTWGAWEDEDRAALLPGLEEFLKTGAGVIPYVLYESPAMDAHGKDAGVHYGWGAPEDLCFIRKNGNLRRGHEIINELMAKYPLAGETLAAPAATTRENNSFRPGQRWLDTDGNPIQAHGGGILKGDNTWYWYGENKGAETTVNSRGIARTPLIGVSCYSSQDLYNWTYEGLALSAVNEAGHDLNPVNRLIRVLLPEKLPVGRGVGHQTAGAEVSVLKGPFRCFLRKPVRQRVHRALESQISPRLRMERGNGRLCSPVVIANRVYEVEHILVLRSVVIRLELQADERPDFTDLDPFRYIRAV